MALIRCPECGKEISDSAKICPNCGFKIKKKNNTGLILIIILGIIAVAILLCLIVWFKSNSSSNTDIADSSTTLSDSESGGADISDIEESVVLIKCYDSKGKETATGSGFVAFNDKTIVTNYHVMETGYSISVLLNNGTEYPVEKVAAYSEGDDIAILQADTSLSVPPLLLGDTANIKKGDPVTTIGSPEGLQNTISTGIISGLINDNMGELEYIQISAPISHGSSGGALLDDNYSVIGVTSAGIDEGQNLNFAIPIEDVIALYNAKGETEQVKEFYTPPLEYDEKTGAVIVTFEDLREDVERYDGMTIMISGYLHNVWLDNDNCAGGYLAENSEVLYEQQEAEANNPFAHFTNKTSWVKFEDTSSRTGQHDEFTYSKESLSDYEGVYCVIYGVFDCLYRVAPYAMLNVTEIITE